MVKCFVNTVGVTTDDRTARNNETLLRSYYAGITVRKYTAVASNRTNL